jgi:hypothetical protein
VHLAEAIASLALGRAHRGPPVQVAERRRTTWRATP